MSVSVSGWMFLLVPAHPGCPGQNPQSCKTFVCVCVCANCELVYKFCYLGDLLNVEWNADAAVEARIRIGWNKFRQLLLLLASKDMSLNLPSLLWHCWLGGRTGIWPVKTEWLVNGIVICREQGVNDLHMVRLMLVPLRHLLLYDNPELFNLSSAGLASLC